MRGKSWEKGRRGRGGGGNAWVLVLGPDTRSKGQQWEKGGEIPAQKSEHLGEQEKVGCPEAEKPRKKRIAQPGGGDNPRQGQDRAKSHAGPSLSGVEPRCMTG